MTRTECARCGNFIKDDLIAPTSADEPCCPLCGHDEFLDISFNCIECEDTGRIGIHKQTPCYSCKKEPS